MTSMRQTDSHVYFWGGPFSNFHECSFAAALWRNGPRIRMSLSETYMMVSKALLFGDTPGFYKKGIWNPGLIERMLAEKSPYRVKSMGREVQNYNEEKWQQERLSVMFRGLWAKFTQSSQLTEMLLMTGNKILVEGAPNDRIWGVGLRWDDPRINDEANWLGKNYLGKMLMAVRDEIDISDGDFDKIDPFKYDFSSLE